MKIKKKTGFIVPRNPLPMSYKGYEIKDPKASYSNSKKGVALNTTVQIWKSYGMRSILQKQKNYRTDIIGDKERAIRLAKEWIDARPENQKKSEFLHQDVAEKTMTDLALTMIYERLTDMDADRIIKIERDPNDKYDIIFTYRTEKTTNTRTISIG